MTNRGRYIPAISFAPSKYRTSAIRSLISRAYTICSSETLFRKAYAAIKWVFISNGYHPLFIDAIYHSVISNQLYRVKDNKTTQKRNTIYWKLPYKSACNKEVQKCLQFIHTSLRKVKVQIAAIFHNKDS